MLSQALSSAASKLVRTDGRPVEWAVSTGLVGYEAAVAAMEARAAAIAAGDRVVVGEDPDLVMLGGVERNHRPTAHPQQLTHRQDRTPQDDRDFDIDGFDLTHWIL